MEAINALTNSKAQHPDGTPKEVTPMVTKFALGTKAKHADPKIRDIKMMPLANIQCEAVKTTQLGGPKDDSAHQQELLEQILIIK